MLDQADRLYFINDIKKHIKKATDTVARVCRFFRLYNSLKNLEQESGRDGCADDARDIRAHRVH